MEQRKYGDEKVVQCILDVDSNIDDQENDDSNEFQDAIFSNPNFIVNSEDDFVADFVEELHQSSNWQFVSRTGEVWSKAPTMRDVHRACAHNIVRDQHDPSRYILNTCGVSAFEAFKILLTDDVIKTIVDCANVEGMLQVDEWQSIDENEIHYLFGLLLLIGVYRNKNVGTSELWSEKDGIPLA